MPALAHAIGAKVARITNAGHHIAASAHAKREQVAVSSPDGETIVGGTQGWMPGSVAMACRVDLRLRLLDPNSELEGLVLQRHTTSQQHLIGVARAMASGQDGHFGRNITRAGHESAESAFNNVEILYPAGEPNLSSERLELPAESSDDERKAIGAKVGTLLVDDRGFAMAVGQDLQDADDVGACVS